MKKITFVLFALLFCWPFDAFAKGYSVLADAESTQWLTEQAKPLLRMSGVSDESVCRIINSSEVNAFVAPDKSINFFTGLIEKADTEAELIAVLAHEIGHIKGQHHFRISQQAEQLTLPTILSGIAGIGASVAGAPQVGTALILGGQAAATSNLLRYSRTQEREADIIAFDLLQDSGQSVQGLVDFFDVIKQGELLYSRRPPAYLLSHPLTGERIDAARNFLKNNPMPELKHDSRPFWQMKARLFALTHTPAETLRKFPAVDKTNQALYARAIAYAIQGKSKDGIALMQELLTRNENNPYFHDMLGQIYVDSGEVEKGTVAFEKALKLKPELHLTRLQMAQAYLALEELDSAYNAFSIVRQKLPKWPSVWHGLGITYGKKGLIGESHLALAEESFLKGDIIQAKFHVKAAQEHESSMGDAAKRWLKEVQNTLAEK